MTRTAWGATALSALLFSGQAPFSGQVLTRRGISVQQRRGDEVRAAAYPNGVFHFSAGPASSSADLRGQLSGCTSGLDDGSDPGSRPSGSEAASRVLDPIKKGGAWYLTFQASLGGNCNVGGRCGAATDTTLVWLKLTLALKVAGRPGRPRIASGMSPSTVATAWKPGRVSPSYLC